MFWPQVLRGIAIMFCLLPPTRLALGALTPRQVPDASGLFNLMRNLGGAIGIAVIDTILYGRTVGHGEALRDRLLAGDVSAAKAIGLDVKLFLHPPPDVTQATIEGYVRPMVGARSVCDVGQRSLGVVVRRRDDRAGVGVVLRQADEGANSMITAAGPTGSAPALHEIHWHKDLRSIGVRSM